MGHVGLHAIDFSTEQHSAFAAVHRHSKGMHIVTGLMDVSCGMQDVWQKVMVQHMRRHAERLANMFVVNATTPAQMFHALRRQLNRPFQKPLVLLTPKFLLHHRPATSALQDFTTGTFFNRVIDDGKVSPAIMIAI